MLLVWGLVLPVDLAALGQQARAGGYEEPTAATNLRRFLDSDNAEEPGVAATRMALPGLLSIRGLPPVPGTLTVTDASLIFQPADGPSAIAYPLYGQARKGRTRKAAVSLLGVERRVGVPPIYLFHLNRAVFETTTPGRLQELVNNPRLIDSLPESRWTEEAPLAERPDAKGMLRVVRVLGTSLYADSLYALFGTPARPLGVVGPGARLVGRLGEYISSRDSVSLDPSNIKSNEQLRHAFVHELAHRWQLREPRVLKGLWKNVSPVRDSLRYGYRDVAEHQAEAVAFAIHYLQATAREGLEVEPARNLLQAYERLVPGTRIMVRYLLTDPLYRRHPLRNLPS